MRLFLAIGCVLLLSGCFFQGNLRELRDLNPQAEDFNGSLAAEYLAYADSQQEQARLISSEHFAIKGVAAAKGQAVDPDMPDATLPDEAKKKLTEARDILTNLLTDDMKAEAPQKSARAQLLYDCWQYQAGRDVTVAPCADEFRATLGELVEIAEDFHYTRTQDYALHFAGDMMRSSDAKRLDGVVKKLAHARNYAIGLTGYSGADEAARTQAEAQVQAVKNELIARGIYELRVHVDEVDGKSVHLSKDASDVGKNEVLMTLRIFERKGKRA